MKNELRRFLDDLIVRVELGDADLDRETESLHELICQSQRARCEDDEKFYYVS